MKKDIETKDSKKRKKGHKIILIVLILILVIAIGLGSWFGFRVYSNGGGEFNFKGVLATIVGHDEQTLKRLPKVY